MKNTKEKMIEALRLKYMAQIAEAEATLGIYFSNSVGIGEHPQHLEEMDKLIESLANAKDKLDALSSFINENS
jgi:hypothetical protein